jgi:hypothetical protein
LLGAADAIQGLDQMIRDINDGSHEQHHTPTSNISKKSVTAPAIYGVNGSSNEKASAPKARAQEARGRRQQ